MAREDRRARVQISKAENGQPSIKVDGVELNMKIGRDVSLIFVDTADVGHWQLTVNFVEAEVEVDVEAEVNAAIDAGRFGPGGDLA